jgi:hypothetical protein
VTPEPYPPLPVTKHVRVYAEMVRTVAAVLAVLLNATVLVVVLTR